MKPDLQERPSLDVEAVSSGRVRRTLSVVSLSLVFCVFCAGQAPKPNSNSKTTSTANTPAATAKNLGAAAGSAHEMTAADVEAFLDGLMPLAIERDDIAGAVVAVVKDGKVLFSKGYGYADVAKKVPVSPDATLFRPGSISKLFTWTSVMQLVEQGKLDLDRDVNDYLDFKIPATYQQPITLRHIMTHTAGFGETAKELFVQDTKDMQPLRAYLVAHLPNRIFPPGQVPAYSNYATTLAGYIVERVSGKPFNDYIRDNILTPLGMSRTTFVQPLPDDLKPLMSGGYRTASGGAKSFEVVQAWPAGSVSTAAMDMTHFMIAHLQNGEYNGTRILRADTAKEMHSRQFAPHPAMNGMALGFYEETRNGHRIIGHGGDTVYFHSDLHLLPNDGVGFFVSYNSAGKGEISNRTVLWHKFLDRYFPYQVPAGETPATAAADAREVAGYYMASRRHEGNVLAALNVVQVKVFVNADGTISADQLKDLNGKPKKFSEIEPLVFRDVNDQDRLAFRRDPSGNLYAAIDYPFFIFQRVSFLRLGPLNLYMLGASAAIMLLALVFWPVAALVRRHYGSRLMLSKGERRLRLLTRLVCALDVIFLLGLAGLASSLNDPGALNAHLDPKLHALQVIGVIGAVGTLVAILNALRAWRSSVAPAAARAASAAASGAAGSSSVSTSAAAQPRWWWSKVFETLIAFACLGFVWFAVFWNLLNFTSNF